ncbi:MAG: DMT family transporter [Sciscionella sp.]
MAYLLLMLAIGAEVSGTVALKLSAGFTKLAPSIVVVLGYGAAFVLLSLVLKRGLAVGLVYAVWAAIGVAAVAVIGAVFLAEPLNATMIAGLLLVIGGVVLLEVGGARA